MYGARRVADYLAHTRNFVPASEGPLDPAQMMAPPEQAVQFADVMQKWPKFTALGAIGPDMLVFLADFGDLVGKGQFAPDEIMLKLAAVYALDDSKRNDWQPLIEILDGMNHPLAAALSLMITLDKLWTEKVKEPVADALAGIAETATRVVDVLTHGLVTALNQASDEFHDAVLLMLLARLPALTDVFSLLEPKIQRGEDEQTFSWFEMLHYRRTSQMAVNLLRQAAGMRDRQQHDQFLAYTLGYICHLGIDIAAHPYVNEQAGGPYRLQGQRHHLVENHIDAWAYQQAGGRGRLRADPFCGATPAFPTLAQSALYFDVQLAPDNPNGKERPATLHDDTTAADRRLRKDELDCDGEMPDWLAEGIVNAMIATYFEAANPAEFPAILEGSAFQRKIENDRTYRDKLLGRQADDQLLKRIAPAGSIKVPAGFPLPWEVKATYRLMLSFWKRSYMDRFAAPTPTPPPGLQAPDFVPPINPSMSAPNQWKAMLATAMTEILALKHTLDSIEGIAATLTTSPQQFIFEKITIPLWRSVRISRWLLTHYAYSNPDEGEIDMGLVQLGGTSITGAGRPGPQAITYPFRKLADGFQRPWVHPGIKTDGKPNEVESFRTTPGPYLLGALPDAFFAPTSPGAWANPLRLQYERASDPPATDRLNERFVGHGPDGRQTVNPLGAPVAFSAYLMGRLAAATPLTADFNLDSDRGYGYLCWDWNRGSGRTRSVVGRDYFQPCSSPEKPAPLRLHYKAVADAGCEVSPVSPDSTALGTLSARLDPAPPVPLDQPVRLAVHAEDSITHQPVQGTVTLTNFDRGATGHLIEFASGAAGPLITLKKWQVDKVVRSPSGGREEIHELKYPMVAVKALGYAPVSVDLGFREEEPVGVAGGTRPAG
jgi:hypothetical protein